MTETCPDFLICNKSDVRNLMTINNLIDKCLNIKSCSMSQFNVRHVIDNILIIKNNLTYLCSINFYSQTNNFHGNSNSKSNFFCSRSFEIWAVSVDFRSDDVTVENLSL